MTTTIRASKKTRKAAIESPAPNPPARKAAALKPVNRKATRNPQPTTSPRLHRTPANDVAALRQSLALPRVRFARLIGRTERALIDWETGKAIPQGLGRQRLVELQRLTNALAELFDLSTLGPWFDTPNPAFNALKPTEVIERGESDRIWQMIFQLRSGTHT